MGYAPVVTVTQVTPEQLTAMWASVAARHGYRLDPDVREWARSVLGSAGLLDADATFNPEDLIRNLYMGG